MKLKLLAAALAAAMVTAAQADKVTLKSGSFLTGVAGDIAGDELKFKSDDLGDIAIKIANIASLESAKQHVIVYTDKSREEKELVVDDGELMKDGEKLDMTTVKAIDPEVEAWHGSLNGSASLTRGNTVGESASIVGDLSRRWEKDRLTANGGYYYGASGDSKQDKQKTTSRFELQAQEDHFITGESFYAYGNGKYEFDRIMDLKYRWRLGLGVGYQWLDGKDFGLGKNSFNQEIGMSYILEKYDGMKKDDYGTFRYAHHYTWDIACVDGLAFAHNFEFLPQVDDWSDNYLIDTDAGFTYAFRANWQLIARVEWDYKKKVGPGTKHSDLRYILGLGYKW